jgi:hypothetical protein
MHILIANDSPSFRKEAREMIETIPFVSIVEEAKSGKEAFVKPPPRCRPYGHLDARDDLKNLLFFLMSLNNFGKDLSR